MPAPDTLDPSSLDRLVESLLAAGFEPVGDKRSWTGPLHPALRDLTDATTMRIVVRDGWPFRQPKVYVEGLELGQHRNAAGDVCLWEEGDPSGQWRTWEDIAHRVEEWAAAAHGHPTADDPGLDPHLSFTGTIAGLATIDLTDREIRDWDVVQLRAQRKGESLQIGEGDLRGRWYGRRRPHTPPQTLGDVRVQLRRRQQDDLDQALSSVGEQDGISFLVFAWQTPGGDNLLILGLERGADGQVVASPYEAARTDVGILRLRAGPDASALAAKKVVIFGAGAIGSHVADLLARSGVGQITMFDAQRLRPGDLVRHAANALIVGYDKVIALRVSISAHAPWTTVITHAQSAWAPSALADAAEAADLVIDAVGLASLTAQLSMVCAQKERTLVSVALYRRGDLGRVRTQTPRAENLIAHRPEDARFPVIPPGDEEAGARWEAGCGSPIAQASPVSVAGIAATAARVIIDQLLDRVALDSDIIETYVTVPDVAFGRPGVYRFPAP